MCDNPSCIACYGGDGGRMFENLELRGPDGYDPLFGGMGKGTTRDPELETELFLAEAETFLTVAGLLLLTESALLLAKVDEEARLAEVDNLFDELEEDILLTGQELVPIQYLYLVAKNHYVPKFSRLGATDIVASLENLMNVIDGGTPGQIAYIMADLVDSEDCQPDIVGIINDLPYPEQDATEGFGVFRSLDCGTFGRDIAVRRVGPSEAFGFDYYQDAYGIRYITPHLPIVW